MRKVPIDDIQDGMVLSREVCGMNGNVILNVGTVMSQSIGRRLRNWGIGYVFVEGAEEKTGETSTSSISPEKLLTHLTEKFSGTLENPYMQALFDAVYRFRLQQGR